MAVNSIHLVGRAGRDPEVKYFESGSVVCNFTLAVNRRTSNKDEPPDWFDLEVWGKSAEAAANYVKKGALLSVQGNLKFDHWTDKNSGTPRSRPVVRVNQWNFEGSKKDNSSATMNNYPDEF